MLGERTVTVALIQQGGLVSDRCVNLEQLLASIAAASASGADLIVPTELSLTRYFAAGSSLVPEWAVDRSGPEMRALRAAACQHEATIVVPVYLSTADRAGDNVAVVIGPDGADIEGRTPGGARLPHYTKVHLPQARPPGSGIDEPRHFAAGDGFAVFDTPIGRLGLLICYDRRFPEAWRTLALAGAEIVAVPSCIPLWSPAAAASSSDLFVPEIQTRAAENPMFIAACCRVGEETYDGAATTFIGRSCVVAPGGTVLAEASPSEAEILVQEVDLGVVAEARRRLTVLDDRRPETYVLTKEIP